VSEPTTVSLVHLGCARNLIDSEVMLARMAEQGCRVSGALEDAEVGIVNTCSFIGPAREESEGAIRDLIQRKQRGELRAVVVAGASCSATATRSSAAFPEVDLFAEISDYRALAGAVRELGRERAAEDHAARATSRPAGCARRSARARACSRRRAPTPTCASRTAATTPARSAPSPPSAGPHRSKRPEAVLDEARELIGAA
jgi:ribosomal protein S12 methylthiotransferase